MPRNRDELIPTRATLIHRLKNWQDQSGWEEFFETYWKLIYGVARHAGLIDAEAQDVVQETMVAVAKHMPGFKYDPALGSFKAWLLNLTRWRIIDQLRKRNFGGHAATVQPSPEDIIDPACRDWDEWWESEWQKNVFETAVDRVKRNLEPQKYQIFDFCVNKEWPPQKVAEAFGIPIAQVYLAKHRVSSLIKEEVKRLEKEVHEKTPAASKSEPQEG